MLSSNADENKKIDIVEEYEEISHEFDKDLEDKENENIPAISLALKNGIRAFGNITSWLSIVLILSIIVQVSGRYIFHINSIALEELQWHLYAIGVVIGLSYAMVNHSHVRVDILRVNFSEKLQRKIEIVGILFLMFPFIFIVVDYGWDLAAEAYRVGERSDAVEGLSHRWIIKAFIPLSFFLLGLAALARLIRYVSYLMKGAK